MAESLFYATLNIFGMRRKLSEALRIINCLRALAQVFMIQQNEADVPEMLTEPGKWLDGETLFLKELLTHDTRRPKLIYFVQSHSAQGQPRGPPSCQKS
jgi:hypothetical protein